VETKSKGKTSGASFTVRFTDGQHTALEALANLEGISVAELVRKLVSSGLEAGLEPNRVAEMLRRQQDQIAAAQRALAQQ
jgi:hypothetical protein